MSQKRIQELSKKWIEGSISDEEKLEFDTWYGSFDDHMVNDLDEKNLKERGQAVYQKIIEREGFKQKNKSSLYVYLSAACIALTIFCSFYLYFHKVSTFKADSIVPGSMQATLQLEGGKTFQLDSLQAGELIESNGVVISKTDKGELIYAVSNDGSPQIKPVINTLSTPKGGEYRVTLPDGTRVWLNAASSIRFPYYFDGNERLVEVMGEAYFDVASNEKIPFKVKTRYETIEVLGTEFNISSYPSSEKSITTLVTGSVKINTLGNGSKSVILKPGQQASSVYGGGITVQETNTETAIAWKNGYFMFNNTSLPDLLNQLARWYDIEVVYEGQINNYEFVGKIERSSDLNQVLAILKMNEIAFKLKGRKLIINPH